MSNIQLSKTERAILKVIIKKGMIRIDELHKQLNRLSRGSVNAASARLRKKGLVRRIPDLTDMRFYFFVLSEEFASRLKARREAPIPS